jgi:small nuclear ribonucleoprotein (snRNP)-like protein
MALNAYLNSPSPLPHIPPYPPSNPILERVTVLTLDGRTMIGTLHSCDGSMNLVLQSAIERIIRPRDEEVASEEVPLGLYIVRGDSVAVVGRCGNIPRGLVSRRERAGDETQSESIFEAQGTERDAVGFGYTAFALWDEGNMIPTKD